MSSDDVVRMGPPPIAILFVAMIISLAILVPLTGVLVRFRANYNRKLYISTRKEEQPLTLDLSSILIFKCLPEYNALKSVIPTRHIHITYIILGNLWPL